MNRIIYILLLFTCLSYGQTIRYVSATGGGNGTSEASPWSLSTALGSATSGMTVYIKKGVYTVTNGYTCGVSGTSGNLITFKGYNNVIGDLDNVNVNDTDYSTLTNGSMFPILDGSDSKVGWGITFNGDYVSLQNFVIKDYLVGSTWNTSNGVIKNVAYNSHGIQDGSGFTSGEALRLAGDNNLVEDALGLNFGSIGFNVTGANNILRRCHAIGNNESRPNGYYLLFSGSGATGNLAEDCVLERHTSDSGGNHQGHGYIAKDGATYNTFRNCTALNTGIEASYKNTHHNTWENIDISVEASRYPNTYAASLRVVNGSHDNLFKSISINNNLHAIEFRDYDDGTSSDDNIDANEGGSNNTFINVVADRTLYGIWFSDGQGAANSSFSNNNVIINSTFNNTGSSNFLQISQNVQNLTFVNTIVNGIVGGYRGDNGGNITGITFTNCNFSNNNFSAPSGTNITTLQPPFVSSTDFSLNSNLLDIGIDPTAYNALANTDYLGATRNSPYSLGAYEYGATTTPPDPEEPTAFKSGDPMYFLKWINN